MVICLYNFNHAALTIQNQWMVFPLSRSYTIMSLINSKKKKSGNIDLQS